MHAPWRRGFVASALLGLVAAPLAVIGTSAPAQAAPSTGLVISEVYGAGGNTGATYTNDFIELHNPTGAAISVAGMSVQYRSSAGNTAQVTNLTGSVPAGGHYLVQEQAGTTVTNKPLPTPDATGNMAMGAASGVVILVSDQVGVTAQGDFATSVKPANVVDVVGYGTTPTTFETTNTGVALTSSTSAHRAAAGTDTDANAPDFSELTPAPQNSTSLAAPNPGNQTATVGTAITDFTLAATGGTTPYSWTATGLPAGVTVAPNGDVSGTPTTAGTFNVTATVTDATTPTAATATTAFAITVEAAPSRPVDIQILATNDFHGRLINEAASSAAGAAVLAGAVKQLRGVNPNTVFAAAGDLIGASTFESFIQKDKPTIDALNEAGLEVSAVGNHEFDQGYDDLVNRVMAPYSEDFNPYGGATWKYLGANVKFKADDTGALDGTWIKEMDGVEVGFIGAVTEHLPELVSPGGIADIKVTDTVTAANAAADSLKTEGADVVVLLVHEGAAGTDCSTINDDTTSDFGRITSGVNDNVDAIVSGHTHLAYNCSQTVPGWSGRPVTTRPIVSAGQYGTNLNRINLTVDNGTGVVTNKTQSLLPLKNGTTGSTFNYPVDSSTQAIVTTAVNNANVLGAQPVGTIGGAFHRAKLANGTTENRGGESTLGNQVAEIQKWATTDPAFGGAQIAFMNPGGLRTDLVGQGTAAFPRIVTYKDAANVQPFANTLINEDLSGARIKAALEQQWQPGGASRPFLKLGISKGFTYTYDPNRAQGSRITGMYLDGAAIDLDATYSVTVNSFLATGGDNFAALNGPGRKQDTGRTDLQAQVDYFAALGSDPDGVPVDGSQRGVGASFPGDAPASYPAGGNVTVDLTSLSMTGPGDLRDTQITASVDGTDLGSFPVTTTLQTQVPGYDEVGTATVFVALPDDLAGGVHELVITGDRTGTRVRIPFTSDALPSVATTVTGAADPITYGTDGTVTVTVTPSTATGTVELRDGRTLLGTGDLADGTASITVSGTALNIGSHVLTLSYLGSRGFDPSTDYIIAIVNAAPTSVTGTADPITFGMSGTVAVSVTSSGVTPRGDVELRDGDTVVGAVRLTDGEGIITVPAGTLAVGEHTLTLAFRGLAAFEPGTGTVTVTVVKASTTVTGTADPIVFGDAGAVAVAVTSSGGTPSGEVELRDGSTVVGTTTLEDGEGTITVPADALAVGSHDLTLAYLGGTSYEASAGTVTVTVLKASTTVSGTADPITYGKSGAVTVAVTSSGGTPSGEVELREGPVVLGTVTLVDGEGTIAVPADTLAVGSHDLTLAYLGADSFTSSTGTVTVTVVKASTTVTGTADPITFGKSGAVAVKVTSSSGTPSGEVELRDGGIVVGSVTLDEGEGTITVPADSLSVGSHDLTLAYLGAGSFKPGTGTVMVRVVKAPTTVTGTADPITYGKSGTVAVKVTSSSGTPTGTVQLHEGATLLGTGTLANGTASITVEGTALAVGPHDLALTYLGASGHAPANGTVRTNVLKAASAVDVTATSSTVEVKSSTKLTVRVSAAGFTPTGGVQVLSGTTVVGRGTLSAGAASVDVGPFSDTGTVGLTVRYLGDATTAPGSSSASVRVVKQTSGMKITAPNKVKKKVAPTITVVLTGVSPQVRSKVTFRYHGRTVTRYASKGKVTLTLAKLTDTTTVTVTYAGNATYDAVTKRVKIAVRK